MFSIPSWLTGKLIIGVGGLLLILAVLGGCYGQGKSAGKTAQLKHDAPIIATWKQATADWKRATETWAGIVAKQNASIERLKAAQDAKTDAGERMIREAVKRRPRALQRSEKVANAELSGTTLERYEMADHAVQEALR